MAAIVDGKFFAAGGERFHFRGVTYGTFRPRESDGARFPERTQLKLDLAAISDAGFSVVRTYTEPTEDFLDLAADWGLQVFAGASYVDWRFLLGASKRARRRMVRQAKTEVRSMARRLAGQEQVFAISLGNEIPADVVRWEGTKAVTSLIDELVEVVRSEDPDMLVTYNNFPTAEYLPLESLDFLTFNVFLESRADYRRYLTRLHHLAGDRPLVLGEIGGDSKGSAEGEEAQAAMLDWQLELAVERGVAGTCVFAWTDEWHCRTADVEGWHFGLTRADRSPKPSHNVAQRWNDRTVRDIETDWPSMSVVICAYNGEATLDETLRHTCALDYPNLEVIVVDDGSTDGTAEIAKRHPRVRLHQIPQSGLSVARNEGARIASNDLIVYLDSDAYPDAEWPYYLALGLDGPNVGGVGGPNIPPASDPAGAHRVAHAPGGPVHVLLSDDRAEHVPGCNMAFWKIVLAEVGGFDPVYRAAGDDVDLCWKVLDRGWDIGFHPAALVWHHRRPGLRTYLRQQRGYGKAEALVEARHPDRFTPIGTARWRGRIYDSFAPSLSRQRVYRGLYGAAAYQSVYRGGGHSLDIVHQVGLPLAALMLLTAPLAALKPVLGVPALVAAAFIGVLFDIDVARAKPPHGYRASTIAFRAGVAALHMLQPLVRIWGRWRHQSVARQNLPHSEPLPGPVENAGNGVLFLPHDRPRADIAAGVITHLRRAGLRILPPSGWEPYDARLLASPFLYGDVVTSAFPETCVQLRVKRRPRIRRTVLAAGTAALIAPVAWPVSAAIVTAVGADMARGVWRTGPHLRNVITKAAAQ